MEKLYVAQNSIEAHLVKHQLDLHDIPCEIRGEFLWGARGELSVADTWPTIWIHRAEDRERALPILDAHNDQEANGETLEATWTCPECGETLEPQFEVFNP